ncbi:MAG TPA: NRDE family protein [Steroidobacteraceae bacterium]|nr:NRDE family protein [Steroidobacteraceae bacterium]
MCLLVLAWNTHPRYRLVVAANRDEYHDRPTAALGRWPAPDEVLAGRDLRAGGTWLGIDRRRHFGIVTNFRDLVQAPPQAPSRGGLIPGYLGGTAAPGNYLAGLEATAAGYGGFNLLLADAESLWYASNRGAPFARALSPGIHGLSNERLDTPWPKLLRVRRGFEGWLRGGGGADSGELFALLADRAPAGAEEGLPSTGLSVEWERILSSPFVHNERYGTRCSTIVAIEPTGACYLAERRFDSSGACIGETEFRLAPGDWPAPQTTK